MTCIISMQQYFAVTLYLNCTQMFHLPKSSTQILAWRIYLADKRRLILPTLILIQFEQHLKPSAFWLFGDIVDFVVADQSKRNREGCKSIFPFLKNIKNNHTIKRLFYSISLSKLHTFYHQITKPMHRIKRLHFILCTIIFSYSNYPFFFVYYISNPVSSVASVSLGGEGPD